MSTRHPPAGEDKSLQSLMADLESSIATFDERFSMLPEDPPVVAKGGSEKHVGGFPSIDLDARREISVQASAAVEVPEAKPATTSLLAQLAEAAAKRTDHVQVETERRQRVAAGLDAALRLASNYLQQLTTHLNALQPETPHHFALTPQSRFSDIRWRDSSTRTESDSTSEKSFLRKLTLRVHYVAQPLLLHVAGKSLQHLEKDMHLMNLKVQDDGLVDVPGLGPAHRLQVEGNIPLQLAFTADIGQERLILRCRNLLGLGLSAYAVAPSAITETALDTLGRCLLGSSRRLPDGFVPIAFNTPDSTA